MRDSPLSTDPFPSVTANGRAIVAAQIAKVGLRLAGAAVLARLLLPEAYGLHGMAIVVHGLLYMIRDLGVFTAMQQPGLTPARFNALCRVAIAGGFGLALASAALGWPLAWFYQESQLPPVVAALGLSFVFGGCAVPPMALLYREQRIGRAMSIDVAATAVSLLAAIAASAAGWGVWALVTMAVVFEVVMAAGAWASVARRPGLTTEGVRWAELFGLGANLTGYGIATYCARTIDQVLVGRSLGTTALGFYNRGAQATTTTMMLAVAPFSGWAVAQLARHQNEPAALVATFRRLLNGIAHFAFPAAVACVLLPEVIVGLLYGERWLPSAGVVQWLGLALLMQPAISAQNWLLQATAQVRRLFAFSVFGLVTVSAGCLVALGGGITAVALGVAVGTGLHGIGGWFFWRGRSAVRFRDLVAPLAGPALLHGGLAACWLVARACGAHDWGLLAIAPAYYLAALAVPAVRRELRGHFLMELPAGRS